MYQILKNTESGHASTHEKYKFLIWEFETAIKWNKVIFILFLHITAAYMIHTFPYRQKPGLLIYVCLLIVIGEFGVTAGAHRYWTHRSFKAKLPLRLILIFSFTIAGLQSTIGEWVSEHRQHHKYSDSDADPHNSRRGFFFSHIGSLMMEKHPEVVKRTKEFDNRDIFEDPLVAFHERHYFVFRILLGTIFPSVIPTILWGESWIFSLLVILFPKYVICSNMIYCVNSVAHLWGTKPYNKNINSTENALVSILTIGEGYHNYHHTFPWDYRTSELGNNLNLTMHLLDFFHKLGWAYDMKTASPELVKKVVKNKGDSSHYMWGREIPEENSKSR